MATVVLARQQGAPLPPPRGVSPAQNPALRQGNGLILGHVVDAATGQPVPRAVVTLGTGAVPQSAPTTMTTSQGEFVFRDLARGLIPISVQAEGYIAGRYGQELPDGPSRALRLDQDQRLTDVVIKLWRTGSITGTVLDEVGEPVVGVSVRVVHRLGSGQLAPGKSVRTDDRGIYRISSLVPGDYLIAVPYSATTIPTATLEILRQPNTAAGGDLRRNIGLIGLSSREGFQVGDLQLQPSFSPTGSSAPIQVGHEGPLLAYPTVFAPSAATPSDATVVALASGQERTAVDVQLSLVSTFRVSGIVTGADGAAANLAVRLVPNFVNQFGGDASNETANTVSGNDGRFTFLGVPPGPYTLKVLKTPRPASTPGNCLETMIDYGSGMISFAAECTGWGSRQLPQSPTEPTLSAQIPVSVGDRDVVDLSVFLSHGARVRGRLEFEGGAAPSADRMGRLAIELVPVDSRSGQLPPPVSVDVDQRFATMQYPEGRYLMAVAAPPAGWTVKSAFVAGRNVLEHPLVLTGEDVTDVTVTLTTRATRLNGVVRRDGAAGDPHARVIVFPADYQFWIEEGMSTRRLRVLDVKPDGTYDVRNLLPGAYLIAAVDAGASVDTSAAATISALARVGTRVTLADGGQETLPLTVRQIR